MATDTGVAGGCDCAGGLLAWALAGSALQRFFRRYERSANAVMGVMLLGCAVSLLY